jgi:protein-tyrosine-phosphatase
MVAQLLKGVRRSLDLALHPRRTRAAQERILHCAPIRAILVLCHGNICRSPFAAHLLGLRLAEWDVAIRSAGFLGQGRTPPDAALTAARIHQVELVDHRSQLVVPSVLEWCDLVLVMDGRQRADLIYDFGFPADRIILLGDLDPARSDGRAIADPWDRPYDEFVRVYARIERCVGVLAALLTESGAVTRRQSAASRSTNQPTASPSRSRSSTSPGRQSPHLNSS